MGSELLKGTGRLRQLLVYLHGRILRSVGGSKHHLRYARLLGRVLQELFRRDRRAEEARALADQVR